MSLDPLIPLVVRLGIALLFAASAWHKIRDWPRTGAVIAGYRIFPREASQAAAAAVIAVEFAVAATILLTPLGLHAAAIMLVAYAAVIGLNIVRGNDRIDCGCIGFAATAPRLTWLMVGRNCVIALSAELSALSATSARAFAWMDFFSLGVALAILGLLYAAFDTAIAIPGRSIAS